ncbi:MBL fold metallo-hydrolase [Paraflavitalea speifideaquila]|uniref:MBL fold metallo-hydrolase n=1 Tax=Paraflavitalea speifideaquila TaxID=3076558 RepID=UPI0028EE8F7B|nr:MBL fold metallo-hydrolase [Paraflavitalea speifideiaquila]
MNHVFISHADRDHLMGLFQFNQLNAREGLPVVYYPKDSGSFPSIEQFTKRFDPHVAGTVWRPIAEGEALVVKDGIEVEAIRNGHVVVAPGITKSLSYKVVQVKQKLRPELLGLSGEEIRRIILEKGKEQTTLELRNTLLGYSADTPVENLERWNHCKILIHEATFLGGADDNKIMPHSNKHSNLEEVMEMVSGLQIETLILGHFSSRYDPEQIDRKIRALCDRYAINIPVHRVLPGEVVWDVLRQKPLNG